MQHMIYKVMCVGVMASTKRIIKPQCKHKGQEESKPQVWLFALQNRPV